MSQFRLNIFQLVLISADGGFSSCRSNISDYFCAGWKFFQTASSNIMSNEGKINNNCFKLYNYVDVQLYAGALTVIFCSDF